MIRTFSAPADSLNIRDYFAAKLAMDQVRAIDAGEDYFGGRVYHAFGTNLIFKEEGNQVSISGVGRSGIWEVKRELSHLVGMKLRKVKH